MLFSAPILDARFALRYSSDRWDLLRKLFILVRHSFSEIEFQLIADSNTINAQAVVLGQSRCVRLYGGLAFHPHIGPQALLLTLLHEVGHHLAVGSRLAWNPMLACDCVADRWAAKEGAEGLKSTTGYLLDVENAANDLECIMDFESCSKELTHEKIIQFAERCWALSWPSRKANIIAGCVGLNKVCPLAQKLLGLPDKITLGGC
jgi:hypothetical protein